MGEQRCALWKLGAAAADMPYSLLEGFRDRMCEVIDAGTIAEIDRLRADIEAATAAAPVRRPTAYEHAMQHHKLQMEQAAADAYNSVYERSIQPKKG